MVSLLRKFPNKIKSEKGSSILEVLISIIFTGIIALSIMWTSLASARYEKYTEVGNIAMNLSISKAEELAGVPINQLNDSYDLTENNLKADGHEIGFQRVTNVTVNADGSRTILITINADEKYLPSPITYETTFAPWES